MKKISEEILYQGQWLSLKRNVFVNTDNKKVFWENIERKNNAVSFAIIAKLIPSNRYILIRQFRHAVNNYIIGLPAGIAEIDVSNEEDMEKCIIEELKEETGYTGKLKSKSPVSKTNPAIMNNEFFIASVEIDETDSRNKNTHQTLEPSEEIEIVLIKKKRIGNFLMEQIDQGTDIGSGLWFLLYKLD